MISTGSIDAMAAIMRKGMTGARLPIIVLPMARKASGENEAIDRLRPSHGPQNTPATKAHKKMLTNCHTLTFMTASFRFRSVSDNLSTYLICESKLGLANAAVRAA